MSLWQQLRQIVQQDEDIWLYENEWMMKIQLCSCHWALGNNRLFGHFFLDWLILYHEYRHNKFLPVLLCQKCSKINENLSQNYPNISVTTNYFRPNYHSVYRGAVCRVIIGHVSLMQAGSRKAVRHSESTWIFYFCQISDFSIFTKKWVWVILISGHVGIILLAGDWW